jgi:uncharacterized LabA/DUF88 family protein
VKVAVLIDGGFLRASANSCKINYDNEFIGAFSNACLSPDEYLFRVMYYDAPRFSGRVKLPVSGAYKNFQASNDWLHVLARYERFAVRQGVLAFRGWTLKGPPTGVAPVDSDFSPVFEQKGVDMRIGLDIATFSQKRSIDRLIIVSGDTDMVPAVKHARKAGLEVAFVQLPQPCHSLHNSIVEHCDLVRPVAWPT